MDNEITNKNDGSIEPFPKNDVPKTSVSSEAPKDSEKISNSKSHKTKENNSFKKELISWVKTIVMALVLAYLITTFIIVNAVVPSGSMETTVMTNDRLVANRLSYVFGNPERYDIIVFKYPDDEDTLFIKRIIGMPGETITIKDGEVYVEGQEAPLDDSFINGSMDTSNINPLVKYPMTIKIPQKGDNIVDYKDIVDTTIYDEDGDGKFDADCYIVLGDNRNNSADSRFWGNKFVSEKKIEGKAVFRYFPLGSIGTIG